MTPTASRSCGTPKADAPATTAPPAPVPAAQPPKASVLHRLHNRLSRQQYEAGCRFRDDWYDSLDCKVADLNPDVIKASSPGDIGHERLLRQADSRGRYHRASTALLTEASFTTHSVVTMACIQDEHPEVMARRAEAAHGAIEQGWLAQIMAELRVGLDVLARHYEAREKK